MESQVCRKRRCFAVLYISVQPDRRQQFFKLFRATEPLPDFEKPAEFLELEEFTVNAHNAATFISWTRREAMWKEIGVWYAGRPGLVWTAHPEMIQPALAELALDHRSPIRYPWIVEAPCRFDERKTADGRIVGDVPFLRPTRDRTTIRRLGSRYPNCGLPMYWVPREVLEGRRSEVGQPLAEDVPSNPFM